VGWIMPRKEQCGLRIGSSTLPKPSDGRPFSFSKAL